MRDIRFAVRLGNPQDIIMAVPHLLSFHPRHSLVLLGVDRAEVVATVRVDLPPARHRRELAEQLVDLVLGHAVSAVVLLVFTDNPAGPTADGPPHTGLIDVVKKSLHVAGMHEVRSLWAQSGRLGAPWCSYDDPTMTGSLPDPTETQLAATSVAAGLVTYASREELAAQLTPADDEILARRQALLDENTTGQRPDHDPRAAMRLVSDTIETFRHRGYSLGDDEVVQLAWTLSDPRVRDACLAFVLGRLADAAERLWLELTRACPTSVRANPATLLAFSAYVHGNGTLASIALDHALTAHPTHRLGGLLRTALDAGLSPDQLVTIAGSPTPTETSSLFEVDLSGTIR